MARSPLSPGPRPPPTLSVALTGDVRQLAALRQQCAQFLPTLPVPVVQDVQLVVTELAANVLRHTGPRTGRVLVRHESDQVHVEVADGSEALPRLLHDAPVGGRGIRLVAAVARAWGVHRDEAGKTVWVDVPIP